MRLNFSVSTVLMSLLLVLAFSTEARADKSYRVQKVAIVADLRTDGSMAVAEDRTYRFKGSYRFAFRTFPTTSDMSYTDFAVEENGEVFYESDSEDPGTFRMIPGENETELRWYYRARNETRTFRVSFVVHDAVARHQDAAVLYHKFVGDEFRKSTGELQITVNPPEQLDQWQVRQWAHGPLWGFSETSADGVVSASCEDLPRRRFFELRIMYPAEVFGQAAQSDDYVVGEILAEEEDWAEAANRRREKAVEKAATTEKRLQVGSWLMPLVLFLAVAWFVKIARQYGRRPVVPKLPAKSAEVPSDLPPAIVQYLLADRSVTGSAIMGTLLDLARRGFLEFGEEQVLGKGMFGREKWTPSRFWLLKREYFADHQHELAPFEAKLITFVFEELAADPCGDEQGVRVDTEAFKKQKSKVVTFFGKWSKEVQKTGEAHDFFAQESFRGRNRGLAVGGGLLTVGVVSAFLFHAWALLPGIGGFFLMLSSLGIVHRTAEGELQARRWKGLRKHLTTRHFKNEDSASVLNSIEPYLIYGTVLGLNKQQVVALGNHIPSDSHHAYVPWYIYSGRDGAGPGDLMGDSIGESFGASFSASISAVNSAMSSSTGAGGGASGGGGGGSGGGGGGAG